MRRSLCGLEYCRFTERGEGLVVRGGPGVVTKDDRRRPSLTRNVCQHVLPGMQAEVAETFAALLARRLAGGRECSRGGTYPVFGDAPAYRTTGQLRDQAMSWLDREL
ncbi:MAG: hypothetical protein JJLCMIEE_03094 [Acidimicrobiales bacterium]|nr:MAG: hypothetical protein EDR02_08105 [Actinomycetota bacterium]MBV6509976.1 hypothetical protein [Acidimicrobiales bacterium]RIK08534.1 MAG: hypothetical protein DCC48_00900 [Acidobacteriota bacterium]